MYSIGTFWFLGRVDAEQERNGFTPISAICLRVEQAHVELHVRAVIACEHRALRRLILE